MKKHKCKYCNELFSSPQVLKAHETLCLENPNREPMEHDKYRGSQW